MAARGNPAAVPVQLLCTGLYVVKLDRPWIETPFLFQGFRITAEDLQVLREYCRHVYIDARRSDPRALETLRATVAERRRARERPARPRQATGRGAAMPSHRALAQSAGVLFGDTVMPDRKRFAAQVQAAAVTRHRATQAMLEALRGARMGRALDVAPIREVVHRMAERIVADPSASLWLNQLREHNDREARHAINTCVLALAFGAYLGIEGRDLRRLGLGALLHDIGKTRIPPALLDKSEPLTRHEWDVVQRHPQEGYDLLASSGHVERDVLDIVRMHHERWRGQGYPHGMLGETIPRNALIVGLVESFDAMTNARPYQTAVTPEQALQTLYHDAGQTFGAELVQALIRCLGIFPVGSVVELENGACGVVVGSRPGSGIWPTVLLVRSPDGEAYHKRVLLNLMAEAKQKRGGKTRRVRRAVTPKHAGIDVSAIVQQEFGLAAAVAA